MQKQQQLPPSYNVYSVCWQGKNHDISNLAVPKLGSLYPPMETTLKITSKLSRCSDAVLPMPVWSPRESHGKASQEKSSVDPMAPVQLRELSQTVVNPCDESISSPNKMPAQPLSDDQECKGSDKCGDRSQGETATRRRSYITVEVRPNSLDRCIRNSNPQDDLPSRRSSSEHSISTSTGTSTCSKDPAATTRSMPSMAPDVNASKERQGKREKTPKKDSSFRLVQIEVTEEGYPLLDIGGGVQVPYIGTRDRTRAAMQMDCLDGSSSRSFASASSSQLQCQQSSTILAECSVCHKDLVCLFGMACVMCMQCTTVSPVVYDPADLQDRSFQPRGLGIGLRLDRMVL